MSQRFFLMMCERGLNHSRQYQYSNDIITDSLRFVQQQRRHQWCVGNYWTSKRVPAVQPRHRRCERHIIGSPLFFLPSFLYHSPHPFIKILLRWHTTIAAKQCVGNRTRPLIPSPSSFFIPPPSSSFILPPPFFLLLFLYCRLLTKCRARRAASTSSNSG